MFLFFFLFFPSADILMSVFLVCFSFRCFFFLCFFFRCNFPFLRCQEDKEEMESGKMIEGAEDIPPQMLFCHQGQRDVKELHFHPQVPGLIISTASDGFNLWKPCNL